MDERALPISRWWHWVILLGTTAGVAVTVGYVAAGLCAVLGAVSLLRRTPRLLAVAALAATVLVPIMWFAGSDLPLSTPAPRIQDNALAHQVGGLAVWLMFLAVVLDENRSTRYAGARRTESLKEEEHAR